MNKVKGVLLAVLLTLVLLVIGCRVEVVEIGDRAPNFKLQNIDKQLVSLNDFRGRPVLINFWATWCIYCLYEMPLLEQVNEEWADKGLVMLAIDKGESPARVEAFLKSRNISLLVLLDTDEEIAKKYNVTGIPTTFFIDKDGIIQDKVIGAFPNQRAIEMSLVKIIP